MWCLSVAKKTLSHYYLAFASFTHSHCIGAELYAAVISGVLQILAAEITAHLTECSCQSKHRRDINWRHYPALSALPFSPSLSCCLWRAGGEQQTGAEGEERHMMRQGEAEIQRKSETERERKKRKRNEVLRDNAHAGCHAPAPCVAASKYPAPH